MRGVLLTGRHDTTVAKLKKQSGVDWAIVCYAGGISRDVITRWAPEKRVKFWESKLDEIKEKRDNALFEAHRMWGYMIHRVEKE